MSQTQNVQRVWHIKFTLMKFMKFTGSKLFSILSKLCQINEWMDRNWKICLLSDSAMFTPKWEFGLAANKSPTQTNFRRTKQPPQAQQRGIAAMNKCGCFAFMNMSASVATRQSEETTLTPKVTRFKFTFRNLMRNIQNCQTPVVAAHIIR